jgi:hypothetical protein
MAVDVQIKSNAKEISQNLKSLNQYYLELLIKEF